MIENIFDNYFSSIEKVGNIFKKVDKFRKRLGDVLHVSEKY